MIQPTIAEPAAQRRGIAAVMLAAAAACSAGAARADDDPSFLLTATARDFAAYFPSYLANGYLSTMTGPRGTEANLAYVVAFMDYAKDDPAKAEEHLAVLEKICLIPCEEYDDLKKAIAAYRGRQAR